MSKFKEGQKYRKVSGPVAIDGPKIGDEVTIKRTYSDYIDVEEFDSCTYDIEYFTEHFEPAEDRTNWHPHHDVIVAWAKGAKVRCRHPLTSAWTVFDRTNRDLMAPVWNTNWIWEVVPEHDQTAEIAEIERKMRELSESQKELADRLEKLK